MSCREDLVVEPLAGWTVAVTAERRADEQARLLSDRGARVLMAPLVQARSCEPEPLRLVTEQIVATPPHVVVANTAVGMRGWLAQAASWGMGEDLHQVLRGAEVLARGAKAAGALLTEGIPVVWQSEQETLADVEAHLLEREVAGARVVVQLDGSLDDGMAVRLAAAGAKVTPVAVYEVVPIAGGRGADKLVAALEAGDVDAVTFTSPAAVRAFALLGLRAPLAACAGPVTAAAAGVAGLRAVAVPRRSRLGPMVGALGLAMAQRSRSFGVGGSPALLQGSCLVLGESRSQLTRRERALLEVLLDAGGRVVSKAAIARSWGGDLDEHAVEVAVNRLRRKLGPAARALETTNRRGYRLCSTGTGGLDGT